MIEIKKTSQDYKFYLDKVLCSETKVLRARDSYEIETRSSSISRKIANYKLSDLRKADINIIKLSSWCEWTRFNNHIFISEITDDWENISASFTLIPDLESWKFQYSLKEFQTLFADLFHKNKSEGRFHEYDREIDWFEIEFKISNKDITIGNFLKPFDDHLRKIYEETIETLNLQLVSNSIINTFLFPEELKTPCEQYLIYFATFLKDLGIDATSNLKEEAGKVLFSITPTDDVEALDKIRAALALYLNVPSSPIIYNDSFASIRLQAEVERLQSSQRIAEMEFRVVQKALESQDKIIHQQSVLLEQQAKVIERITDKAVMINSAENKEELEKIYEGIEIGESKFIKEQLGIKFNPAKVVKTIVKNTLGKGDEIIELGLDKKE